MTPENILDLFREAAYIIMLISVIILAPGMLVGILISMFQAATQINEMTLTFVSKFLVTLICLFLTGHWLLNILLSYSKRIIDQIPYMIG